MINNTHSVLVAYWVRNMPHLSFLTFLAFVPHFSLSFYLLSSLCCHYLIKAKMPQII